MSEYENKKLQSVMTQIREAFEVFHEDPVTVLGGSLDLLFILSVKESLMFHYKFCGKEALDLATNVDVDLNNSDFSRSDVVQAADEMVEIVMGALFVIREECGQEMYDIMLPKAFSGCSLKFQ